MGELNSGLGRTAVFLYGGFNWLVYGFHALCLEPRLTAAVKLLSLIRCFVGCCLDFLEVPKRRGRPKQQTSNRRKTSKPR